MRIEFIGHATFLIVDGDARVLIDPFLAPNNPAARVSAAEVDPTHVLLTHGHADHCADAVAVAGRTGASVVAITDLARWLGGQGLADVAGPNLGGTVSFDWGTVKLVPAWHTNSTPDGQALSSPAGLLIDVGGTVVYHLGDTCLFGDLRLIGERHQPDLVLVPIGGHFTMDRHDAAYACELLGAATVIPCHYDTFPAIEADATAFKAEVEERTSSTVVVLEPGQAHEL